MKLQDFTESLIRHQTVTGNTEEIENALQEIRQKFGKGFRIEELSKEGVKSLLIYPEGTENFKVLLHGHIDVVNAQEGLFKPERREGKIYGRGSADMKAGVACIVKLMQKCSYEGMGLLITSDEEKGGFKGAGYAVKEKDLRPELVISAEPDDSGDFPSLVNRQKGVLQIRIAADGSSAHASKPEKGENAAEKLIGLYDDEIKPLFSHTDGDFPTTVNLGKIKSGDAVNRVPNHAEMELDIRFSEQYQKEEILNDLDDIEGLSYDIIAEAPMMKTDPDSSIVRDLRVSAREVTGEMPELRDEPFASDMRFFTSRDIPALCFGPEGYGLHAENEHVVTESMHEYCEILKNFLDSEFK